MKYTPLLSLLAASLVAFNNPASAAAKNPEPAETTFRAVTWNLQWFPGRIPDAPAPAQEKQREAARAVLADLNPDIVFMQEIRDWESAASLVSAVPGLKLQVVSDFPERKQNVVIAAKFPVDTAWVEAWKPAVPEAPPRGFAFAAIRVAKDHIVLTYSVHFKSNRGEESFNFQMRQEAARQLLEHVDKMLELYSHYSKCSVLVGGDFNTSIDDNRYRREKTLATLREAGMKWVYENVPVRERITIPGEGIFPDGCFDHFFMIGLSPQHVKVGSFPDASDHNPVIVDFQTTPPTEKPLNLTGIEKLRVVEGPPPPAVLKKGQIVETSDSDLLLRLEGQEVTVKGVVSRVGRSPSGHLIFVNFSSQRGGFTAIVPRAAQTTLTTELGGTPEAILTGKELQLHGTIVLYSGNPQMELTGISQIVNGL